MNPDPSLDASSGISQADQLYQSFPGFSAWGEFSPADTDLWARFAANLNERRKAATPEALKAAVEVAVRAAALDTGAIEGLYTVDRGFTMTVAVQGLAWEQMIEERGTGIRELFQAQLEAYELVLDAVTRKLPITEAWIRALHEKLCAPQKTYRVLTDMGWQEQELPKGEYKSRPNHVRLTDGTFHAYAPVDQVASEMHRLVEQLRTPEFEAAHPVLQASYCHYAFVLIHPFADGNGRVARALASTFFYRAESIPLVIFSNQRPAYLNALRAADLRDFQPLVTFFLDRGIDTMQMVVETLRTAPRPEDLAASIKRRPSKALLSLPELSALAARLGDEILRELQSHLENLGLRGFTLQKWEPSITEIPERTQELHRLFLELRGPGEQPLRTKLRVSILLNAEAQGPFVFELCGEDPEDSIEIRLEDVHPEISPSFQLRLDHWVQRQLGRMLANFQQQIGS